MREYIKGEIIGGFEFVEEVERKTYRGNSLRSGIFICPICNDKIKRTFKYINRKRKIVCCGCIKPIKKHGHCVKKIINGKIKWRSDEFVAWKGIKARCYNKNEKFYYNYGERGITMCDRWINSFENFLSDMGFRPSKKHSIDRIDNNGNYEPSNCKWSTHKEQCNNKRNTIYITDKYGVKKTIREWSDITGLSYICIKKRRIRGLSPDDILNPVMKTNKYG